MNKVDLYLFNVFPRIDFTLDLYSPSNSIRSIFPYEWNNDRSWIVFAVIVHTKYVQGRIAGDAVFRKSQLTAEVLAAYNDPFLTSDDDEDEWEANELTVYCTEQHVIHVFGQGLTNCIVQRNCTHLCLVVALT